MPIALVQSTKSAAAGVNLAYGSNNTAGNLLIAVILPGFTSLGAAPTDTQGNTWHLAASISSNFAIYYAMNCNAGANTLQSGYVSATKLIISIYEFSGVATSGSLDVGNGSTSGINAGITTTGNGDLVFASGEAFNNTGGPNPTVTTSAGWTAGQTVAVSGSGLFFTTRDGWQVQTSAGAIDNSAWTVGGGSADESVIAAFFKASAATGGLVDPMGMMGMVF